MKNKKMIVRFSLSIVLFLMGLFLEKISFFCFFFSYVLLSYDIYLETLKKIQKFDFFDEGFLMIVATIGAIFIGELEEAVMVFFLYQIGEYFGDIAVGESRKSIVDLLSLKVKVAHLKKGDRTIDIPLEEIKEEDVFVIKKGEVVPTDGILLSESGNFDTSSLTGESVSKIRHVGDSLLSGFLNTSQVVEMKAEKKYEDSTISHVLKMVEESENRKTKSERFITKFAHVYTPMVVLISFLIVLIPTLLGLDFHTYFYRALVFLVISCPCALVISVPLSFFCGIGASSKNGILFKGSNELEEISKCNALFLDKTGTLTKGNFALKEIIGEKKEELLKYAAYAEYYSIHPIASIIKKEYKGKIKMTDISDYKEYAGKGVIARVGKDKILVGNEKLFEQYSVSYPKVKSFGTILMVAKNETYLGAIVIQDEIKESSYGIIQTLKEKYFSKICILSGDDPKIVSMVAEELGISESHGKMLPEDKLLFIKKAKKDFKTIFIGDGINDAPALQESTIGISMGGVGSDVAIEASDVVFMNDDLGKLNTAISISKKTRRIVWQNIFFSLSVKFIVMILGIFGIANMWMAVFSDVGVTFLAILNALRIFYGKP